MNGLTKKTWLFTILLIIIIAISITIVGLAAAIFVVVKGQKNSNDINEIMSTTVTPSLPVTSIDKTSTSTSPSVVMKNLSDTINSTQLMFHLKQLQVIADNNNNTRAMGTSGFNATINYIETELKSNTNFDIFKQEFFVRTRVPSNPILTSTINGVEKNYIYKTDFQRITSMIASDFLITSNRLTVIPNSGCNDSDWQNATPYPATNSVVLVIHGPNCPVREQTTLAENYNITGFLVYDSNINATSLPDPYVGVTTYPSMIITYKLGAELIEATKNHSLTTTTIRMSITPNNAITVNVSTENLCADTPTGNKTQIIVVGSHSDSFENFAGINDNGSGTIATLALALNLAQLFQTSSYEKYLYRIRFCWFAAEELNSRGSYYHVAEANTTTIEGRRLKDYLMMLNFDMFASPNFYFGILEDTGLPGDAVSSKVRNSTRKISQVFRNWFDDQKLPWDNSSLSLSSDHLPFLFEGVPSGGIHSGGDGIKTLEQRNRYARMLGHGYGGIAGVSYDRCNHLECDTIENTNPFAFETMTKSAAYALETFARIPNLDSWLYTEPTTKKHQ